MDGISDNEVKTFMKELRADVNYIKKAMAENATNQAILTANLANHIHLEETIERVQEEAFRKVTVAYVIIGILSTLIVFIAGYKIGENNNKFYQKNKIDHTEQSIKP